MEFKLPSLAEYLQEHKRNFDSCKKLAVIPSTTTWEMQEALLRREHARLSRMDKTQYKSHCEEAHKTFMALMKAKLVETDKLIKVAKQREELQGDLHEFREREKFDRKRKGRR